MFHHHADDFEALGATEHLFHCFKHFVTYAQEYDLVSNKEKEPLKDLIASWAPGHGSLDVLIKVPTPAAKDEEPSPPVPPPLLETTDALSSSAAAPAAAATTAATSAAINASTIAIV